MKSCDLPGVVPLNPKTNQDAWWLAKKMCGLLRGFDHERRSYKVAPPELDSDLWVGFKEAFTYIKRRYVKDLSLPLMVRMLKGNHRFMVQIRTTGENADGSRARGFGNLAYTITAVKCIQGHSRTATDHPQRSLIGSVRRVMTGNPWRYGPEEYAEGKSPGITMFPHLITHLLRPKVLYHYTTLDTLTSVLAVGLFPGGAHSEKPFVFMTSQSPWKIGSSDEADLCRTRPLCLAIDTELAVMQGYRLLESESGHFLCEDWISNVCFIYVYDMAQDQYLWTNRAYPRFRKDLNNTIEEGTLRYHDEFGNDPSMPVQGTGTIRHPDGAVGKHA